MDKAVVATLPGLPGACGTIAGAAGMVQGRCKEMLKVNGEPRSTDTGQARSILVCVTWGSREEVVQ